MKAAAKVRELGEDRLIDQLTAGLKLGEDVVQGAGDDCAVIRLADGALQLQKTDCMVEGVHFVAGTDAETVGRKALARAISDIGAMGGQPQHALVTILIDPDRSVDEVVGWYRGMARLAEEFGVSLVGGETASTAPGESAAVLSVSLTGSVKPEQLTLRSGASVGDRVAVTGKLGGSFDSGRHLTFAPRVKAGQWLGRYATAMMDLSDGLAKDLSRLCLASGVEAKLDLESLPLHDEVDLEQAMTEGEDYELLVTLPSEFDRNEWQVAFPDLSLTVVGECVESGGTELSGGWQHF
ncbi:MAG: thiamine-phosphate kinase [Verrucomicrobiota bacterium]